MKRSFAWPAAAAAVLLLAGAAGAERAWVKDELTLNLRTGPGNQFRILSTVQTGDAVEIVSNGDGWTQVRAADGKNGWVPAGFLQSEAPARIRLERFESDTARLRGEHGSLSSEVEELRLSTQALTEERDALEARVKELERENVELRAGARWPEWIAGASILIVGGLLGMIVHASSARRQTRRIKL